MQAEATSHPMVCDRHPLRLLGKVCGDYVEVACRDCKKDYDARLVVHRYAWDGRLLTTIATAENGRTFQVL